MRLGILLVIVVVLVAALGAGGAFYYWVTGSARANSAIKAVRVDIAAAKDAVGQADIAASAEPKFPDLIHTNTPDDLISLAQAYDAADDKYGSSLNSLDQALTGAESHLADARKRLDSAGGDWLTLPERSQLDRERRALAPAQQALDSAQQLLLVARRQSESGRSILDGASWFGDLSNKLDANDFSGATDDHDKARGLFDDAATFANGAHLPPGWTPLIADLTKLNDDTERAIQALQSGGNADSQASVVDQDAKALEAVSLSSLAPTSYLQDLAAKIDQLYAEALKAAQA